MNRIRSLGSGGRRRSGLFLFLAAGFLAWTTAMHTGCLGGTTGVDNPGLAELPVDFRDGAGNPAQVQGTLEIYDREHNPAVTSEPLLRFELRNTMGLVLTREEFDRIGAARAPKTAGANGKRSAAAPEGPIRFNLVFRSGSASGAVATGLSYDPVAKVFGLDSASSAAGVRLLPKPLIRFAARVLRGAEPGSLGRVFLPGTPFQATLVDSDFALQNLPEGRFGMRLLGDKGYIYAVRETLDTQAGHVFTAEPDPIGRVDSAIAPAGFGVGAGGTLNANMQESVALQGQLLGAGNGDSRIAILWRLLRSLSTDSATIADPTRLNSQILFPTGGSYALELSASLGATTVRDTVFYKVASVVTPAPGKFLAPLPGDSVKQGQLLKVAWESPVSGKGRLEYNYKDGAATSWVIAVDSIAISPGGNGATWNPPVLGIVSPCLLRVRMIPSDSILAQMQGPFFLVP